MESLQCQTTCDPCTSEKYLTSDRTHSCPSSHEFNYERVRGSTKAVGSNAKPALATNGHKQRKRLERRTETLTICVADWKLSVASSNLSHCWICLQRGVLVMWPEMLSPNTRDKIRCCEQSPYSRIDRLREKNKGSHLCCELEMTMLRSEPMLKRFMPLFRCE